MEILKNDLVGQYACPTNHPITCANPAPWLIIQMRIELRSCDRVALLIRGEKSIWFHASDCLIGDKEELEDWLENEERKRIERQAYRSFIA